MRPHFGASRIVDAKKYSACALRLRILHYLWRLVCLLCSGRWDFHILCDCIFFIYIIFLFAPLPYLDLLDQNALLCQMQLRDTPYTQRTNKQTQKKKSDLLGKTKWRCVLKCSLSLSVFPLCSSLQAVETNLASKDSHWVYANEVRPDTNTCTHLCTCKTGQWSMLMQHGSRCCVARAHGNNKKKSRHICFLFFF